jgi:hypothetical protein
MKGRRQVKYRFFKLEQIEKWIVYMCHSEGECAKHNTITSSQLDTTVGNIGVQMGQHPCGMILTPCRVHDPMN